jgi:hypothetical protein
VGDFAIVFAHRRADGVVISFNRVHVSFSCALFGRFNREDE